MLTSEAVLPLAITAAFVSEGDHTASHATWGYMMIVGVATQVFTGWIRTKGLKAKHANYSGLHRVSEQRVGRASVCREAVAVRLFRCQAAPSILAPTLLSPQHTLASEREKVLGTQLKPSPLCVCRHPLFFPHATVQFNKHFHIWSGRFAYVSGVVQCYRGLELVSGDDDLIFSAVDGFDVEVT